MRRPGAKPCPVHGAWPISKSSPAPRHRAAPRRGLLALVVLPSMLPHGLLRPQVQRRCCRATNASSMESPYAAGHSTWSMARRLFMAIRRIADLAVRGTVRRAELLQSQLLGMSNVSRRRVARKHGGGGFAEAGTRVLLPPRSGPRRPRHRGRRIVRARGRTVTAPELLIGMVCMRRGSAQVAEQYLSAKAAEYRRLAQQIVQPDRAAELERLAQVFEERLAALDHARVTGTRPISNARRP